MTGPRGWLALLAVATLAAPAGCGGGDGAAPATTLACEDVPFTADSDDVAAEIRATGVTCDDARALIRASDGAPARDFRGYVCTSRRVEGEAVLIHSEWRCARNGAVIAWKRF